MGDAAVVTALPHSPAIHSPDHMIREVRGWYSPKCITLRPGNIPSIILSSHNRRHPLNYAHQHHEASQHSELEDEGIYIR